MSKKSNLQRYDLSDYLIHFVRPMKIDADDAPDIPEHWGWGNINEDVHYSPFFILRCIVRQGRIWATWSYRGGKRTIYGRRPAACFTEMPLAAFVQSSRARASRGEKISPYGLVVPKGAAFDIGARPVIYSLSSDSRPMELSDGTRVFAAEILPETEQYRYVTYNPSQASGPDWTHEREWRWPGVPRRPAPDGLPPTSWEEMPGLDLFAMNVRGMGAIVRSQRQANLLIRDILGLVDQKVISVDTFRFILTLDGIPPLDQLWRPENVRKAIDENAVDLEPFFTAPPNADELVERFMTLVGKVGSSVGEITRGEHGGCWLWLHDNTHPLVRALQQAGCIEISRVGRYLVPLPQLDDEVALHIREELTKALATRIEATFGTSAGYFSVRDSNDPNDVPFYCDLIDDEELFYNLSYNEKDF